MHRLALSLVLLLSLAACATGPGSLTTGKPFALDEGRTYAIIELVNDEIPGFVFCRLENLPTDQHPDRWCNTGAFNDDTFHTPHLKSTSGVINIGGSFWILQSARHKDRVLLVVPALDGKFTVWTRFGGALSAYVGGSRPSFSLREGKLNYLGSYPSSRSVFITGEWVPDGVLADLKQIGAADHAEKFHASRPDTVFGGCERKPTTALIFGGGVECRYRLSEAAYLGLVLR